MKRAIRCLSSMLWYGFAGVTVLAAVFLTLARLLLPLVEDYRVEVENALSQYAGQPVRVATLKAEWNGFEPLLHFSDVRLYDKQNKDILFQFADASMGIDVFASVKNRNVSPSSFTISDITLSITRHADKSISVDGLSAATKTGNTDFFLKWLLRQPDIGIEKSTIKWTDIPLNEKNILFEHVDLRLRNDENIHQLTGHVVLPENLGKEINIALEMQGGIDDIQNWEGDIYVKATNVQIPSWWRQPLTEGLDLAAGNTSIEMWGKWQDRTLTMLEGKLSLANLELKEKAENKIPLQSLATSFLWKQDNKEWSLHLSEFSPVTEQGAWPVSDVNLRYEHASRRFAGKFGYMQLSDVLPILDAFKLIHKDEVLRLSSIKPHAVLRNTSLLISKNDSQWHVDGRFSDFKIHTHDDIPGITGLSGSFALNNQQGSLQVDSNKIILDTAGLFRKPINLLKFTGSMQWQREDASWIVEAADFNLINEDLSLRATMSLVIPDKGSAQIDLLAYFKDVDGSKISEYLPVKLLDPETTAWLDKSIIQGTSPQGNLILRGPLDKFPFDNGEGKFETRFDVINATLDYEPGWPIISEMQGEIIFSGRSLNIIGDSGRILNANIHEVTAYVEDIDLDNPLLELKGHVDASTSDVIKYVVESNLAEGYSKELKELDSSGKASLKLDIKIPMATGDGTVIGQATLKNAAVGIKGNDIRLESISGNVAISNKGLQADALRGRLFNTPVKIQLSNNKDATTAFSLKVQGQFDLNQLVKDKFRKDIPIISEGSTEWLASLSFQNAKGDVRPVVLEVESELKGVRVNLPEPFAKDADALVAVKFGIASKSSNGLQLDIDYGDEISAIVALSKQSNEFEYAGASIAFGDALPLPPSSKRISIVGQLDVFSLDDWLNYGSRFSSADTKEEPSESMAWLEGIDVKIDTLKAMGSTYFVKKLNVTRDKQRWKAVVDADRIKGDVFIPFDVSSSPVQVNLEFLKLGHIEGDVSDTNMDPRELPAVALSIDQLVYDGVELGSLNMSVLKTKDGLNMDKFALISPDLRFTANGTWQVENNEQITRFNSKLKSERFSSLLTDLGYSVGFEAGKSRNRARLEWKGSPFQFAVEKINGTMKITIYKGQLLDISPGAGRIFGLLSLQALPRRLTLDFSDLFKKGFSFDEIKGNFQLDQGNAYTTDLFLDGPAARLDVSGRTGLASRDYDQLVTVTPDVTGGLPLAGALVGGPIAGGVMFALDKLFRPAIDDITRYQYTVRGSWDDPEVIKLENVEQASTEVEEP